MLLQNINNYKRFKRRETLKFLSIRNKKTLQKILHLSLHEFFIFIKKYLKFMYRINNGNEIIKFQNFI